MAAHAFARTRPPPRKRSKVSTAYGPRPAAPTRASTACSRASSSPAAATGPILGTCGGFQYAFIEFARNVLNIKDADSAENNSGSKNIIIYPVACAVPDRKGNAPKLSGVVPEIRLRPGSYLQSFYGKDQETVTEEFFCNFEINPDFEWAAMEAGFPVVARGPQGEIRAIESPTHRFFLATLFQPQLSSTEKKPHPIVLAFVQAAADWGKKKLDDSVQETARVPGSGLRILSRASDLTRPRALGRVNVGRLLPLACFPCV